MHGAVIGAGPAGISTMRALRRIGLTVELFEQAPEARLSGDPLNIWTNGKYALGQIGLRDALKASGHGVAVRVGHWLSHTVTRLMFIQRMFDRQWNELLKHAIADPLCPIEAAP